MAIDIEASLRRIGEHESFLRLKDQLLIVLAKRLGSPVAISRTELDDTGQDICTFALNPERDTFEIHLTKKN